MTDAPAIPHNREAEEALIGSILINPDAYLEVAGFLQADDFYIHRHRFIWQAICRLQERRSSLDLLTVSDELDRLGCLVEIGGPAYLSALIGGTPTSVHAEAYARIVEQTAVRRRMLEAANQVAKLAYQQDAALETVIEDSERAIFAVSQRPLGRDLRPASTVLDELFDQVEQRSKQNGIFGIPTGFIDLDRLLGGMQPSDLLIVAGRPGMGKTSLLLSTIRCAAQTHKKCVALFSLEMSAGQMAQRLVSQQTGIDSQRLRTGRLNEHEWPLFTESVEAISETRLFLDDTPAITPSQLSAKCRRLQAERGLDLVVIDYLQLMSGGGRFENRTQEIAHISRQLKVLARELNLPVLAAAQLSRAVEQRADKRPVLSDLRESGSIEQDADVVLFLYRPEDKEPLTQVEVEVAKHRNGPVGQVKLAFNPAATRFDNAARGS